MQRESHIWQQSLLDSNLPRNLVFQGFGRSRTCALFGYSVDTRFVSSCFFFFFCCLIIKSKKKKIIQYFLHVVVTVQRAIWCQSVVGFVWRLVSRVSSFCSLRHHLFSWSLRLICRVIDQFFRSLSWFVDWIVCRKGIR